MGVVLVNVHYVHSQDVPMNISYCTIHRCPKLLYIHSMSLYSWQIWQYRSLATVHLSYIPYLWKLTVAPTSFKCSLYIFCRVEKKSRSNITHSHWQNEPQPGAVSLKPGSRQHTSKLPATPILGGCTNKISCATFRCDCAYSPFAF